MIADLSLDLIVDIVVKGCECFHICLRYLISGCASGLSFLKSIINRWQGLRRPSGQRGRGINGGGGMLLALLFGWEF